ncbi:hypothetical protein ACOMHN_021555 [Nucella lapillus]
MLTCVSGAVPRAVSRSGVSCNICGQTFNGEHLLLLHQKVCHNSASSLQSLILATIGDKNDSNVIAGQLPGSSVNKFSGHCTRNQKRLYRAFAQNKAKRIVKTMPKWDDSRPIVAYWAPKRPRLAMQEQHPSSSVSQEEFMSQCGLLSSVSAVDMKRRSESEEHGDVSLDCQIETVAGPLCDEPLQSPRTTRSLMSQLSRENVEAVRKRLSFGRDSEDQEGSEGETLDSAAARRSVQVSLLAIDCSSPLGQRLKKHMKGDLVVPPITDIEQHCMTIPVLDEMAAKLRHRANEYPIMHRKRKGIVTGYCHTFKFNKAERREFLKTWKTGLNARSRKLLRQIKKCSVRLTRLRPEVIRYWTVRKRTIVHEEIAIDDDLSIVQVDVPEYLFDAVRKMTLPAPRQMQHYRGHPMDGRYLPSQEAYSRSYHSLPSAGPCQLSSHSQHNPSHHSYQRTSSSLGHSFSGAGPVPQFLVKQVSKNWTENGQESQKLVFVPLDEAGPSQHPNVSVRNMGGGSSQRPFPQSSNGIKKSLPRHLRPCPKSQRKRLQDRDDSSEEFVIETASSTSDEDDNGAVRGKSKEAQEHVYPLSLSRARDMVPSSSWSVPDRPVPQMLHIANSTSAGVPVSGLMPFPTGLVPVSWERHMEVLSGAGGLTPNASGRGLSAAETAEQHSELRKHLSLFPPSSGALSPFPAVGDEMEDGRIGGSRDGIPHHSVGSVHSHRTADFHKQQATASSSSSKRVSPVEQPNFLQLPPDLPKLYDSSHQQPRLHHVGHRGTAQSHGNMPRLIGGPPQHQIGSASHSLKQQTGARSSSSVHHPNILRGPLKPQSSAPAAAGKSLVVPKMPSKRDDSSTGWKVVQVSNDDVVEVICIDDD